MKKIVLLAIATTFLELICFASTSHSLSFSFADSSDHKTGNTENLAVIYAYVMQSRHDAVMGMKEIGVPGPGFDLLPVAKFPLLETNPVNSDFTGDLDDMNWLLLNNPKLIPNTDGF